MGEKEFECYNCGKQLNENELWSVCRREYIFKHGCTEKNGIKGKGIMHKCIDCYMGKRSK